MFAAGRARKMRDVTVSLRETGHAAADQGAVRRDRRLRGCIECDGNRGRTCPSSGEMGVSGLLRRQCET